MMKKTFKIIPMMIAGGISMSSLFFCSGIAYAESGDAELVEVPPEEGAGTTAVNTPAGTGDAELVEVPPEEGAGTTAVNTPSNIVNADLVEAPPGSADTAEGNSTKDPVNDDGSKVFGNIYIDMNSDGKTDEDDLKELREIIVDYNIPDYNNQEISGELTRIIYGPITSPDKEMPETPSSYYLSNEGQLTVPKDQDVFGTCWSFAAVSALESSVLKKRQNLNTQGEASASHEVPVLEGLNKDIDLSEKYIAWMIYHNAEMGEGTQDEGVTTNKEGQYVLNAGGLAGYTDAAWTSWRGVVNETDEPYKADNYSDDFKDDKIYGIGSDGLPLSWSVSDKAYETGYPKAPVRVDTVIDLPGTSIIEYKDGKNIWEGYDAGAATMIKQALMDTGGVAITYAADTSMANESGSRDYLNQTTWSQYNDSETAQVDHCVTIVGWDDSYPAENFKAEKNELPPGNGAWLVKNSWGSDEYFEDRYGKSYLDAVDKLPEENLGYVAWGIPGEDGIGTGFFWLSYYDKSITSAIAFGVDIPDDGWDHDNIYQYDYYTDIANYPLILRMYDTDTSVANVFSAKGNEELRAVSVRTVENDARVNVKVYLLDSDEVRDPTDGTLVSEETAEIPVAGFTTLSLSKPVELNTGQRFAVVETVTAASGDRETVSFLNVETVLNPELQTGKNLGTVRSSVVSNAGESFVKILSGGGYTWMDSVALTNELGEGIFTFGNALIKAFTVDIEVKPDAPADPDDPGEDPGSKGDHGGQDGGDDGDNGNEPGKQDDPGEKGDVPEDKGDSDKKNEEERKDENPGDEGYPGNSDESEEKGDNKDASGSNSDTNDAGTDKYHDPGVKSPASNGVKKAAVVTASSVSVAQVTAAETGERDLTFVWAAVAAAAASVPVVYRIVRRKNEM